MTTVGFIGLGVMGAPMCRNLALGHDGEVLAFDLDPRKAAELEGTGATIVSDLTDVWQQADVVLMSLPGSAQVEEVCLGSNGVLTVPRKPGIIIDLSTTSVAAARKLGGALGEAGIKFADAPVARTREAAQRGELAIMVGASTDVFKNILPLLRLLGTDVMHVGEIGSGQFVKLVNNALLDVNVIAIAEAIVLAEKVGVDPAAMIDACSKGSGDSYALRHHAVKSLLPRDFPEKSFPPEYKVKDLTYLLELAAETDSPAMSMQLAFDYYKDTARSEFSGRYFTSVIEVIARKGFDPETSRAGN